VSPRTPQRKQPAKRLFTGMAGFPHEPGAPEPAREAERQPEPPKPQPGKQPLTLVQRVKRDQITGRPLDDDADYKGARAEAQAHAFLGVPQQPTTTPTRRGPKPIASFRELLNMTRFEVAELFDWIVGYKDVPSDEMVLMDRSVVEQQAATLKTEIDELRTLLATRSGQWQKLHRPDDKLEKNDRERLKREETKLLHAKEVEWRTLRSRLIHWDTDPRNRVPSTKRVAVTFEEAYPIVHRTMDYNVEWENEFLRRPLTGADYWTEVLVEYRTQRGDDYEIDGYRKVLQLDGESLAYLSEGMTWDGWREWENKALLEAIQAGLKRPPEDLVAIYPGLGVYQGQDDDIEADTTEDALALRTGGACYGGGIVSAGNHVGKRRNYARKLQDFTKPLEHRRTKGYDGFGGEDGAGSSDSYESAWTDDSESPAL